MHIGGFKSGHNCQIDCTNHDEVINKLEIKSKDLYYFWRNYEWLYQKYYSQKNQQPTHNAQRYQQLQDEIHRLENQNKKLRIENQSMRKKMQTDNTSNMQKQFQRQIERLSSKCRDYETIRDKLTNEISSLKNKIRQLQEYNDQNQNKLKRQIKRQESIIVELQQNIDELRAKMMGHNSNTSQGHALQERYQRQIQKTKVLISSLEQQCVSVIDEEFENARYELLQQFPRIFQEFSRGDLTNIVTIQQIQQN